METKKKSWTELLFAYAKNEKNAVVRHLVGAQRYAGACAVLLYVSGNLPVYGRNGDDRCRRAVVPLDACVLCR